MSNVSMMIFYLGYFFYKSFRVVWKLKFFI